MGYGNPLATRGRQIGHPLSLGGYSGFLDQTSKLPNPTPTPAGITHGTETCLAHIECPKVGYPVLEDLYLNGDAAGSGKLHFFLRVNGINFQDWFAGRYRTVGQDGNPQKIGANLPPGCIVEIWCKNEDAADDTLQAECDGTVVTYDQPA